MENKEKIQETAKKIAKGFLTTLGYVRLRHDSPRRN